MFAKNMKKILKLERNSNYKDIIVKHKKNLNLWESFTRKWKLLESAERKPTGNWGKKWKNNSKDFKRNKIKLIKLKNRKKENLKFRKIGKEFKEKLRGIRQTGTKLFQSKFWNSVFKN